MPVRWIFTFLFLIFGCARAPLKDINKAMRPTTAPKIQDDLGYAQLELALSDTIKALEQQLASEPGQELRFGPRSIKTESYIKHLKQLHQLLNDDPSGEAFETALQTQFEFYEVYGDRHWGEIFITSYYEPVIFGSNKPTDKFSQALYRAPKDMILIDLDAYAEVHPKIAQMIKEPIEQKSKRAFLRGVLVAESEKQSSVVRPYFSREEIDAQGVLEDRGLEIAWVDPIDAFFLQIQGSGVVELQDGSQIRVGYAAQNGHPYYAIGKSLFEIIPKEEMSMQKIREHLRSLDPKQRQTLLNENASYVFFRELEEGPVTYLGTEVTPGRTIATDYRIFPKGALAFLEFEKPQFASDSEIEPEKWTRASRFVVDQDTGGAIRGPHRLDLFWGRGAPAARAAGLMRNRGRLYYIVPKPAPRVADSH